MKNEIKVSVIIANYNGEEYLPTCLSSLIKTSYKNFETIIVDDGSTDRSMQLIKSYQKQDKKIQLLRNQKNKGAAASRNKAARKAKGEILIFLDNDTEVDKEWMKELVDAITESNNVGACQALLIDFENRKKIQVAGVKLWSSTGWGLPIKYNMKNVKKTEIIALSAALAVRKKVFELIGGFDEDEAVVTEDLDLSWRIWIAGYRIVLCPRSIVFHWTKSIDMRKNLKHSSETIYFHLIKNSLISMIKNYSLINIIRFLPSILFISIARSIFILFSKQDASSILGTLKGIAWTMKRLANISEKRVIVQRYRRYSDSQIMNRVFITKSFFYIYNTFFKV